jgi:hypothetical protein
MEGEGKRAGRRTRTQEHLEGRRIVAVRHDPNMLTLTLDNGAEFVVIARDGYWGAGGAALDFKFREEGA